MKRVKIGNPTRTLSILLIAAMPFLFVSCFLFSPQRQGTGTLSISVSTAYRSRDLSPTIGDVTVASYRVTGLGPGGACFDPVIATSSPIEIDGLAPGDWDITVEGMNDANPQVILAEASRTLSIAADKNTSAAFNLVPLEGAGTLALTVKWPDEVGSIDEIRGSYATADGQVTGTFDWDVPGGGTLLDGYRSYANELQGLAAGSNAIVLSFYFEGSSAGPSLTECAIIYKGITTNGTVEIPADFSAPDSPTFSPPGSTYEYARTVTIESSSEDVDIYYTTDGNDPGILSAKYTDPVYIASNLTLKAVAVNSANLMSDVSSEQYRILENTSQGSGSMLLRYGSRLYLLGGKDASGNPISDVRSATIADNGGAGTFAADASLPEGVSNGAAFATGIFVYVMGGETATGITNSINYALINSDGTLGFGSSRQWQINSTSVLPEPRTRAATIYHDGWIYLIGGDTNSGSTDTIIRARLYQDGQIGRWYPISENLPRKVCQASATVLGDRLYIAGGISGSTPVNDVISYSIGPYGGLSDLRIEQSLPEAFYNSILLSDRDDLVIAGGYKTSGASSKVYRFRSGSWNIEPGLTVDSDSPGFGRSAGSLWYLPKGFQNQSDAVISTPLSLADLALAPETPEVIPGSGQVPNDIPIRVKVEPGCVLRYTTNGSDVTPSSTKYVVVDSITNQSSQLPKASSTASPPISTVIFRAFAADGTASPQQRYDYRFKLGGMSMLAGVLFPHEVGYSSYDTLLIQEATDDLVHFQTGYQPTTAALYQVVISSSAYYNLNWADRDVDSNYTARVTLSLLEPDLFTEVPDVSTGMAASYLAATSSAPLHLYLQAGSYYLYIKDRDSIAGRDFGLLFSKAL